jgi:hypothetical protein
MAQGTTHLGVRLLHIDLCEIAWCAIGRLYEEVAYHS